MAEPFPLYFPADARRAFESDELARRIAQVARLGTGSRVLELGVARGNAAILCAKEFGCDVVAADSEDTLLDPLRERVKTYGVQDRVDVRKVDYAKLPFRDGELDAIIIQGRVLFPAEVVVKELRRFLGRNGRIVFTYPVKVGRYPASAAVEFWEQRMGEKLMLPRELLGLLQQQGYEPEMVETLSDAELLDLYRPLDGSVDGEKAAGLKQEIALFRETGKASVSYALAIGRKKEPGEKPPQSRDRG